MTISRSEGIVTLAVLVFSMADVCLSPRASTSFLVLLQIAEVVIQTGELLLPEPPIRLQPVIDALEWCRDERAGTPLRIAAAHHEACAFEHLQVFGNRRLTQGERLHE